ncbi:MAG: glycosyltransferase family 4 protein, partial [Acidimicrobiales bacterium]
MDATGRLRVALLAYRGNPHSGGQGVYARYLARELVAMGHRVDVLSGQPYPRLDPGVGFVAVPSLDLYRPTDPFRVPRASEIRHPVDLLEVAIMLSAGFPEPLTFSLRVRRELARRRGGYDVVHDNQGLGRGLLGVMADGWPLLATIHHPITVDRELDLAHAGSAARALSLRRWYGFSRMQRRVARRIPRLLTVSRSSAADIATRFGVPPGRLAVVPMGVDGAVFRPLPGVERVPLRILTTASADAPLKGLVPLLRAMSTLRAELAAELVVVGRYRPGGDVAVTIDRLGLAGAVSFVADVDQERLVELYASAALAVVPSLYEGFSLPAVEAMACAVPLVSTTAGALPEVVGEDGEAALLVPPGDPKRLAAAMASVLRDADLGQRLGAGGRRRAARFTWRACAEATLREYRALLA